MFFSRLLLSISFLGHYSWLNKVYDVLPPILYAILGVLGGAGSVYAIILGINLAKADSDDARKTASTRLKNTIIGVAVLIVLVLIINVFLPMILAVALPNTSKAESVQGAVNLIQQMKYLKL